MVLANPRYTVFLAGNSPNIRSYTVHIFGSGQPYTCYITAPSPVDKLLSCLHRLGRIVFIEKLSCAGAGHTNQMPLLITFSTADQCC